MMRNEQQKQFLSCDNEERSRIIQSICERSGLSNAKVRRKLFYWRVTIGLAQGGKRMLDFVLAAIGIVCCTPLFLLTAAAIKLESPGRVIFVQKRVGRNGRIFNCYKFRSMRCGADRDKALLAAQNESVGGVIFKMKRDPRITRVGRIIRKFSIDELPQLFNVLFGEMSLVGPRPPVPSEVALYTLEERKRLHVKPGLTCLWQINGRSELSFHQQVMLDKMYINSCGFRNDLIILLKTIPAVLIGRGAY